MEVSYIPLKFPTMSVKIGLRFGILEVLDVVSFVPCTVIQCVLLLFVCDPIEVVVLLFGILTISSIIAT